MKQQQVQCELKNPLVEPSKSEFENISDFLLYFVSTNRVQYAHLINVVDMTEDQKVERRLIETFQTSIQNIDTSQLKLLQSEIRFKDSVLKQQHIFENTTTSMMLGSQLSKTVSYNLQKCSFQLLKKKQETKVKQQQKIQHTHLPKEHHCNLQTNQINHYNIPIQYRSVSSHYSPQKLQSYLNKNSPNLQANKKWLKPSNYETKSIIVDADINQLKNNFQIFRNRGSLTSRSYSYTNHSTIATRQLALSQNN